MFDYIKKPNVREICEFLASCDLPKNKDLSFNDIFNYLPKELKAKIKEEEYYDAIFILARRKHGILKQGFKVLFNGKFQKYPKEKEIIEMMRNDDLKNPLTNEELGEDEFGEQVITYFNVL